MINSNLDVVPVLCTQCGMCSAVCPTDAIELQTDKFGCFFPKIDKDKCTDCQICVNNCGASTFDISDLSKKFFEDEKNYQQNKVLGNFIGTYAGYSHNRKIREKSSSGGIVTSLLKFGLEKKWIQAAVVCRANKDNPFLGEGIVVENPADLIKTSGSKYLPVPINAALKKIIKNKDLERLAVVGLPCQIHSLRKAMLSYKPIKKKDILIIGLFCKQTKDLRFTNFLLRKIGVKKSDIVGLEYRYGDWPGGFAVTLRDGSKKIIYNSHPAYGALPWTSFFFSPLRCLLCSDATAELADLAIGDPWLKEFKKETVGTSLIISRTKKGEHILNEALFSKAISLSTIDAEKIIESQSEKAIALKKDNWYARYKMLRIFYKDVPNLNLEKQNSILDHLDAIWIYWLRFVSSSRLMKPVFLTAPRIIIKIFVKIPLSPRWLFKR